MNAVESPPKYSFVFPDRSFASLFMDENECNTVIAAARSCAGLDSPLALEKLNEAAKAFSDATRQKFNRDGEW